MNRTSRVDLALLAALTTIAAALRFYRIDTGLWFDEIVTLLESVRAPLAQIVGRFQGDNQHPLYSVLAYFSVGLFGESPSALRLPAALFGTATIPLLYLVGRAVAGRLDGMAAAIVLAVSYHHVWFSQNARGYTVVLFCALLSTYALIRWLDTGRRWFLLLYALATAAGAYTHLTVALVAVGQALACAASWASGSERRLRMEWIAVSTTFAAAALLTVLLYAPMLQDVGAVMSGGASSGGEASALSSTLATAVQGLRAGFGAAWGIALGAVVFAAGGIDYLRRRPVVAMLFAAPVVVTVLAAVALERPLRPRFLFFSAGFVLLLAMRGAAMAGTLLARLSHGRISNVRATAFTVTVFTLGAVALSVRSLPYGYQYPKQDYVEAVAFVERAKGDGDPVAVVADGGDIPIVRYFGRPWLRIDTGNDLRALLGKSGPVWVVSTFPSYVETGQPELWTMLENCERHRDFEGTVEDGTITVYRCG